MDGLDEFVNEFLMVGRLVDWGVVLEWGVVGIDLAGVYEWFWS